MRERCRASPNTPSSEPSDICIRPRTCRPSCARAMRRRRMRDFLATPVCAVAAGTGRRCGRPRLAGPCGLPHPEVARRRWRTEAPVRVAARRRTAAGAGACSRPRWTGWSATARARCGSVCGRRTSARSASMRAMASRESATTSSRSATAATTSSSCAGARACGMTRR